MGYSVAIGGEHLKVIIVHPRMNVCTIPIQSSGIVVLTTWCPETENLVIWLDVAIIIEKGDQNDDAVSQLDQVLLL